MANHLQRWTLALAMLGAALVPLAAAAADYPVKPIRIVVPFAPGGGVDSVARTLAKYLADSLGQPVLVENRAGASGNIGSEQVARAPADGYTLLVNASTLVVNPVVAAQPPPFDPLKDFTYVAMIARGPLLFIVHPASGDTLQDFVAKAKAQPARYNLATGGYGSAGHMAAEYLKLQAGLALPVVLYKGTAPAFTDLVGGQVNGLLDPLVTSLPLARSGKVRALAIASARRSPLAPEVPTFAEAGLPGFEFHTWYGLWAPANLPADALARLQDALRQIGADPQRRAWFDAQGLEFSGATGASFRDFAQAEVAKHEEIVRKANVARQ